MATTARLLTYEDLLQLPDDGKRYEIVDGALFEMPSPSWMHQDLSIRLASFFFNFLARTRLGKALAAPLDVRLTPHNIVQPDLVVFRTEHLPLPRTMPVDVLPDLVVEILSPSNREHDEQQKLLLYAAAGIPEYWIVDLDVADVRGYTLRGGTYVPLPKDGTILRSVILPGLEIDVPALFADLD